MTQAAKVTDALAAFEAIDGWDEFAVLALKAAPELWEQIAEIAEEKFDGGRAEILRLITPMRAAKLASVSERLAKARLFIYPPTLPREELVAPAQPKPAPFRRLGDEAKAKPEPQPKAEPTLRLIVAGAKPAKLPPGVIGKIAEFSVDSAMYPIMKFSIAVGIGVVGTLISRRIAGPTGPRGCATHLYQALIGPTGVGKDHARTVGKLLLSTAAAGPLIGPGRFKSGPPLVKHVEQKPVSLCFLDELGAYFEKISDPRASGWEKEISEVLRELWGMNWGRYDSPMGAHDESKVIINPALSLMGLTTPKELYRACKSREVSNGYLNRWNFVEERDQPDWQSTDEQSLDVPVGLARALRKLYKPVAILDQISGPPERLRFGPGAEDVYHAIREGIAAETDDRRRELCWRSPEKTVRIATSIAAGCFDQVVTREYMEWSWDWVKDGDETLIVGVNEYMEEEKLEFGELCKEIIRRIRRNASKWTVDTDEGRREFVGMLERDIGRSFQNNVRYKRDLRDALEHLRETDQLISINLTAGKGRPSYLLSIAK
jgi:hypothetical protein